MNKKIILVFIEAPIPFAGAASRWYFSLASELMKSNFEVDIFAACAKEEHVQEALRFFPHGHFYLYPKKIGLLNKLKTIVRPFSYTISESMKKDFKECLEIGYDVIHIEQTFASWILDEVNSKCLLSVHYLASIDLHKVKCKNLKEKITIYLMKKTERKLISRFLHVKSCSKRIEKTVRDWFPEKKFEHFPFGIDFSMYQYLESSKRFHSDIITLIASMGWYPGKSAAVRLITEIWPELKKLNPMMKLRIVGWNARVELVDYLNLSDVEVLENVPDIHKYFHESSLLIYTPIQGSGVKIKIQEAMLLGTPVVTNLEGVEGLDVINGVHAIVSESNDEIIRLTNILFNDKLLQEKLRRNARDLIINTCDGKEVMLKMESLYKKIIDQS